jgi:hypothetical protein
MKAYIYNADIYCADCARAIKQQLHAQGLRPDNYKNEAMYDSDEWPKGPLSDGGGESDSPQHCGNHDKCYNPIILPNGIKIGCFLENPLTEEGYKYVKELLKEHTHNDVAELWSKFYDINIEEEDNDDDTRACCDKCGAELETYCDGIERCLDCGVCPACGDGGYNDEDFEETIT